jgi:hypothetical protein
MSFKNVAIRNGLYLPKNPPLYLPKNPPLKHIIFFNYNNIN